MLKKQRHAAAPSRMQSTRASVLELWYTQLHALNTEQWRPVLLQAMTRLLDEANDSVHGPVGQELMAEFAQRLCVAISEAAGTSFSAIATPGSPRDMSAARCSMPHTDKQQQQLQLQQAEECKAGAETGDDDMVDGFGLPSELLDHVCTFLFVEEHVQFSTTSRWLRQQLVMASSWETVVFERASAPVTALLGARGVLLQDVSRNPLLPVVQRLDGMRVGDPGALQHLVNLQSLSVFQPTDAFLAAAVWPVSLRELVLRGPEDEEAPWQVTDVMSLSGLVGLCKLDLSYTNVADVTALSGLVELRTLDLFDTRVADVTALSGLVELRELNLSYTNVADVTALSGLVELRTLNLSGTPVADVTALSGLVELRTLDLSDTRVADVTALSILPQLRIIR
jgi:hypothetical protein